MVPKKVLITGAAGLIGGIVYNRLRRWPEAYELHALARTREPRAKGAELGENHVGEIPDARFHLADLADFEAVRQAVAGMDTVVHLAAATSRVTWEASLHSNIIGTYHVLEASRLAGAKRVVFASTNQVVAGYYRDEPYRAAYEGRAADVSASLPLLTAESLPRPTSYYSCSKVFGEALARMYAEVHGLSCICLRIGNVPSNDRPRHSVAMWCSHRDLAQLVQCCIDAPDTVQYDVFYAVSNNRHRLVDIERARLVVGYQPEDRAEDHVAG